MKKLLMLLLAVCVLAGFAVSSQAMMKKGKGKGQEMGQCGEHMMMEKLKTLGLDEKQKEAVKTLHLKMKKEAIKKNSDIEVAGIELREIVSKDVVDLAAAEAKVKQIEAMKTDMKMLHIKTREEVKASLTPEQRKKFSAMHHGMDCGDCGMDCGKGKMKGWFGRKGNCGSKCDMTKDMDGDKAPEAGHQQHKK